MENDLPKSQVVSSEWNTERVREDASSGDSEDGEEDDNKLPCVIGESEGDCLTRLFACTIHTITQSFRLTARYTLPVFTARVHGPRSWHPWTQAVNTGSVYRAEQPRHIITALHVMQTRYCDEISVRLSVRPSVRLSVCHTRVLWQNGRKIGPNFYTIRKNI